MSWRPRRCKPPQATCAGPSCEGSAGVQFEPSRIVSDPGSPLAARSRPGGPGSVREGEEPKPDRKVGGGCIVPMKPRTTSADGLMTESVEGRRPVEGRARHAPDTEPEPACHRR